MSELILAIDRGTTNVKASLFDAALNEVAVASHANPAVLSPQEHWAEADMGALWESAAAAVRATVTIRPGFAPSSWPGRVTASFWSTMPASQCGQPYCPWTAGRRPQSTRGNWTVVTQTPWTV